MIEPLAEAMLIEVGADSIPALAVLERGCLPDPWSEADLRLYLGSGAIVAWCLAADADLHATSAYTIFQLLPGEAELLRLGVLPELRRRGLGRRLLAACLRRLALAGRPRCHLEVREGNGAARSLYEGLGFELTGSRRAYYSDGENALRYVRSEPLASG